MPCFWASKGLGWASGALVGAWLVRVVVVPCRACFSLIRGSVLVWWVDSVGRMGRLKAVSRRCFGRSQGWKESGFSAINGAKT